MISKSASIKGDEIGSVDSFESLLNEMYDLFDDSGKGNPQTFSQLVDETLKQLELQKASVPLKPAGITKSLEKRKKTTFGKTWKWLVAVLALLLGTCLIVVCPIFYDSLDDTLVSKFLNDPYVQTVLPKEYSYQMGVFYMNLKSSFAMIIRRFATYLGTQRMVGSFWTTEKGIENDKLCFLSNPVFKQPSPQSCSLCHGTEEVLLHQDPFETSEENTGALEILLADNNIHVFERSGLNTSLDVLQQHVSNNLHAIELNQHSFQSNISFVASVKDLGKKEIISQLINDIPLGGHIVWYSNEMFILYIQGLGSRTIRLLPPAGCVVKCNTHTVTMETSDILVYDASVWTAYSLPYKLESSFAYVTHLLLEYTE
ncbi:hypothetical protein ElyMa_004414700 [Elysia marginata]|uniref:Uncharacterized protein n=1 Tax=Elysia marginata TaxID=1093978 RepID=A0AAV4HAU5_9GAST|nr:hypothetical protein ElyMa_004414700 [Elysia marginata]